MISPHSPLVHAWGSPPIVLSCGVGVPSGYSATSSETTEVNGVRWFQQLGKKAVTWTALVPSGIGRQTVNVRLEVPVHYQAQGAFLVDLAAALKTALQGKTR